MLSMLLLVVIFAVANGKEFGDCPDLDCSHGCKQIKSITKCTCPDNLILGPDSRTCEVPASLLLLTTSGLKFFKEGSDETNSVLNIRSYAFDYLFSKHEIYAYVDDQITRYAFADSTLSGKPLSTTPVVEVDTRITSLALDWVHSKLYWICSQRSLVETAKTDGSGRKEVASYPSEEDTASSSWEDITVDPYAEKLFWLGLKGLYISDLNGHYNLTSLESMHKELLTVDINNQLIYIVGYHGKNNLGDKVVVRYRYDGSQVGEEVLLGQAGSSVFGLGMVGHTLYWQSNFEGENIYKADTRNLSLGKKDNLKAALVTELYQVVRNFKIYHPELQKPPKSIK